MKKVPPEEILLFQPKSAWGCIFSDKQIDSSSEIGNEPSKYHNRLSPTNHLKKTFGSKPNEEEEVEIDLDEILMELENELEDEDDDLSEEEFQKVLRDLGVYDTDDSIEESFTINYDSKGYKEGMKLVTQLRRGLFRKLDNDELDDFMGVLKLSFGLK